MCSSRPKQSHRKPYFASNYGVGCCIFPISNPKLRATPQLHHYSGTSRHHTGAGWVSRLVYISRVYDEQLRTRQPNEWRFQPGRLVASVSLAALKSLKYAQRVTMIVSMDGLYVLGPERNVSRLLCYEVRSISQLQAELHAIASRPLAAVSRANSLLGNEPRNEALVGLFKRQLFARLLQGLSCCFPGAHNLSTPLLGHR